jgi:hypothetical protein
VREWQELRAVHDTHVEGLFSKQTWLRILSEVGYDLALAGRSLPAEADGHGYTTVVLGREGVVRFGSAKRWSLPCWAFPAPVPTFRHRATHLGWRCRVSREGELAMRRGDASGRNRRRRSRHDAGSSGARADMVAR